MKKKEIKNYVICCLPHRKRKVEKGDKLSNQQVDLRTKKKRKEKKEGKERKKRKQERKTDKKKKKTGNEISDAFVIIFKER